jgi:hypothetical protein
MKIAGGVMNYFKSTVFFSRLLLALGVLVFNTSVYWIGYYISMLYKESSFQEFDGITIWFLTACFILIVLVLMILGWILNCKSNFVINTIVVIATCCAIPHVIFSLVFLLGFLVLPLDILACYLVRWYLRGGAKYQPEVKPALKMKIKLG